MKKNKSSWILWIFLFISMMILPAMAVNNVLRNTDILIGMCYMGGIFLITIFCYWRDKRRAQQKAWRIPESTLHFLELIGGWSAAFWMQRLIRHKIRKVSYQTTFWLIGFLHQFISFDSLQNWKWTEFIFSYLSKL